MAAVAVVTVQKELFKNVAEILLEAQAAGNLISERLGGRRKRKERRHPSNSQGGAETLLVLGIGGPSRTMCFYSLLWGLLCCPPGSQCQPECLNLEREKLGGRLNK